MAAERASLSDVKQFVQRMVDDHTKANDQLKQVASEESITLPEELDAKGGATKARLETLSGERFDHACMPNMIRDHTNDGLSSAPKRRPQKILRLRTSLHKHCNVGRTSKAGEWHRTAYRPPNT